MRIAITSQGKELSSEICPRFGRANYFIFVDPDTREFEAMPNPNVSAVGGAGIQSSQQMVNKDVSAVLSGRVGMNAFRVLEAAGIAVFENVEGTIEDAINKFNSKELIPSNNPKPAAGRHRMQYHGGEPADGTNNGSDDITVLKSEVERLTKELNAVNEKLNRLNK